MSNRELANAVVTALNHKKLTIATAESCTGGMIGMEITKISGSSNVFECGIIAYANRIKVQELSVSSEDLTRFGAVSEQVAAQMAEGVRKKAKADIGVSTTGVAGPTGGSDEKPVGTVYIAVATEKQTYCKRLSLLAEVGNDRDKIREATVENVLSLVISVLNGTELT